jgi:hypothetical protein
MIALLPPLELFKLIAGYIVAIGGGIMVGFAALLFLAAILYGLFS